MNFLKDPVERLLYISLAVVVLCVLLTGIIVAVELSALNQLGMSIKDQATVVERHTDCVALLLTQPGPNRAQLRIQDLTNCKIGP